MVSHAVAGVHHEWDELLVRSGRGLLVLTIFARLRCLDRVGFGMALALAGLRLLCRALSLALIFYKDLFVDYYYDNGNEKYSHNQVTV